MKATRITASMCLKYFVVLCSVILATGSFSPVMAQFDPFGDTDLVYVDSVHADPGSDVAVRFSLANDEMISSFSVPITFDPTLLEFKSLSFEGSRCEHISWQLLTPETIAAIDGHFMVTVARISEAPIGPGDGLLFTVLFGVSDSAALGTVATLDSLYMPPGGQFMFVEDSSLTGILPAFRAGKVVIGGDDHAPVFADISDPYVLEGAQVVLDIDVTDPDGDQLTVEATTQPAGAVFVDNGDGTARLTWTPEFVGPNSSDYSPFTVTLRASDGTTPVEKQVAIDVGNVNRKPQITAPEQVTVPAGEKASFAISAIDPDFEEITFAFEGMPAGAVFDGNNPGSFEWTSHITDSGATFVDIIATDQLGSADTNRVAIMVSAATVYSLSLDTMTAMPNETVDFSVYLDNQLPIESFNLLVNYDASGLSLNGVTSTGTRSEDFEYFSVVENDGGQQGNVRVMGTADLTGAGVPSMPAGSGSIADFEFRVSGNLNLAGLSIPVKFMFLDGPSGDDNTLTDESGVKVGQEAIQYADGYVIIRDLGQIKIGDVNLNGLAFEISDVIYFTNYFMNPLLYNFDPVQYVNSDVNQDNLAATVADLVYLINVVTGTQSAPRIVDGEEIEATFITDLEESTLVLGYDTDFDLGGFRVTFTTDSRIDWDDIQDVSGSMIVDFSQDGDEVRLLVYSMDGGTLPAGEHDLLVIDNIEDFEIDAVELSTADGRHVTVMQSAGTTTLPDNFALHQNYPNPFNPETRIEFDLPQTEQVSLTVYNVLGQRIKVLADSEYPAGNHSVYWNGLDDRGARVSSGIYLYRLETESATLSRKMVLLK